MPYKIFNAPMPTTAAIASVTTGTSIKTMLQVATPSTTDIKIIEWGISFDGSAAATPGKIELLQVDVAATVTSLTPSVYGNPNGPASLCVGGSIATGYTASGEGTTTVARVFDAQLLPPTAPYVKQFPLGREPWVAVSKFLRIRVTFGAAVNAYCYVIWEE